MSVRSGLWFFPGFEASIPGGTRAFTGRPLLDLGIDLLVPFDSWFLALSGDYSVSCPLEVLSVGLEAGTQIELGEFSGLPLELRLSGGPILATLDMDEGGFGDFDRGIGVVGRADLALRFDGSLYASFWLDVRWIEFDFDETVVGGDDSAGGLTPALGVAASFRF